MRASAAMAERPPRPADVDPQTILNVAMAAERTWLAWWRTALVATAGALGVGRLAPVLLDAGPAPYVVLGCAYGVLSVALLIVGARRQRAIARAIEHGETMPLATTTVAAFTIGGILLAVTTTVVVLAEL
jgi:putative membrane protein